MTLAVIVLRSPLILTRSKRSRSKSETTGINTSRVMEAQQKADWHSMERPISKEIAKSAANMGTRLLIVEEVRDQMAMTEETNQTLAQSSLRRM